MRRAAYELRLLDSIMRHLYYYLRMKHNIILSFFFFFRIERKRDEHPYKQEVTEPAMPRTE